MLLPLESLLSLAIVTAPVVALRMRVVAAAGRAVGDRDPQLVVDLAIPGNLAESLKSPET